jgi:hypothetical protein
MTAALRQRWRVTITSRDHVMFWPPSGKPIVMPGSPSDHRGVRNGLADLRRAGLKI